MVGAYAESAQTVLLVWAVVTALVFAVPMIVSPVSWGRMMRFTIPPDTDLAVYFGRCLGALALVVDGMAFRAALTGEALRFVFELSTVFAVLMVFVHAYGGVKRIQPMTETVETALWAAVVVLLLVCFPVASPT
jgi:hypothetical protein